MKRQGLSEQAAGWSGPLGIAEDCMCMWGGVGVECGGEGGCTLALGLCFDLDSGTEV